jgi:4-amino-4-deoxy-L-arabinose transferase-like glycosyltransferase
MSTVLGRTRTDAVVTILLGVVGFALVLFCTSRFGIGISPDSVCYLSAARSVLAGKGFLMYDGSPYTFWPPLYPLLMAGFGLLGIDPLVAMRYLNALVFGMIIVLARILLLRHIESPRFVFLGALTVLFSVQILETTVKALSEPLFILLILFSAIVLSRYVTDGKRSHLFVLVALMAAACLQRYAGMAFVIAGGLLMLTAPRQLSRDERARRAAIFVVLSVIPLGLWVLRNYMLTSSLFGPRWPAKISAVWTNILYARSTLSSWLLPSSLPTVVQIIALIGVVSLFTVSLASPKRLTTQSFRSPSSAGVLAILTATYLLFVVISMSSVASQLVSYHVNSRLLCPIYVFMVVLLVGGLEILANLGDARIGRGFFIKNVITVVFALWLVYPLIVEGRYASICANEGVSGYNSLEWRQSSVIQWLKTYGLEGRIQSNAADAIYFLTGMRAHSVPDRYRGLPQDYERNVQQEYNYLIWFKKHYRDYLYDPAELSEWLIIEPWHEFPDGIIYRLRWEEH